MFTVILLSPSAQRIFERARVFFEPFVRSGDIAFCEWRYGSSSASLAEVVPDLTKAIRGKPDWRVVVVDHPVDGPGLHERHPENPFDYVANRDVQLNLEDSPFPLVRLANLLLGYPDITAKSFERVVRATDPETGLVEHWSGADVERLMQGRSFNEAVAQIAQTRHDVGIIFREVEYSPEEYERYLELEARYRMKEVRPTEVVFIATRAPVEENAREELHKIWRSADQAQPSRFIERNDYPPLCRFAVYELLEPENSSYDQDELRMWLCVLTLATNLMPPSGFQADRVYRLGIEFSNPVLAETLNDHMSVLSTGLGIVDNALNRPTPRPDVDVTTLFELEPVPVSFDDLAGHELQVPLSGYHLAADRPRDEWAHWAQEVVRLQDNAGQFMRRPRRALARAVFDMRGQLHDAVVEPQRLSPIERSELEERLSDELQILTAPITSGILERSRLDGIVNGNGRAVAHHIGTRLRRRTILWATTLVLGLWLAGLVPYLLQASRKGGGVLGGAAAATGVLLVVLILTCMTTLFVMRAGLISRLRRFNEQLRAFVTRVGQEAEAFGEYLGRFVSYRRARELLRLADELSEAEKQETARLRKLRARIRATMDAEKAIVTALGESVRITRRLHEYDDFDPHSTSAVQALFRLPIGERQAEFNHSGQKVSAPYDFITRIRVESVAVAEPWDGGAANG